MLEPYRGQCFFISGFFNSGFFNPDFGNRIVKPGKESRRVALFFRSVTLSLLIGLFFAVSGGAVGIAVGSVEGSCITCHKDPNFLVTNKKLFDYFREWKQSIHGQEGVGCSDCHGGNPLARTKLKAHGPKGIGATNPGSPTSYKRVPKTCAQCHEDFYTYYRQSSHFKRLVSKDPKRQGPNCVTCHASVNTMVMNFNTVRNTCAQCHNEESKNNPEIPGQAEELLRKFLSIHRFYRYLTVRGGVLEDDEIFHRIKRDTEDLFTSWHTFDLPTIEKKTNRLLTLLKEKRNEILQRSHASKK